MRIFSRILHEMRFHGIVLDVACSSLERARILNADFREPLLPERSGHPKFPPCTKRESALDKLHRPFDRHPAFDREDDVEMVGHDYEFVETELVLSAVFVDNLQEQVGGAVRLQSVSFVPCRGGHEERARAGYGIL